MSHGDLKHFPPELRDFETKALPDQLAIMGLTEKIEGSL
jgi:hypothetical protein